MILDDPLRQGQPEAHAVLLGRDEGLKHAAAELRRDSRTGIGDREADLSVARTHLHAERAAGRHCLGAVEDEIHDAAFEAGDVDGDLRRGGEGPLHLDAQVFEAAAHEF